MLFLDLLDGADLVMFWEEDEEQWLELCVGHGSGHHHKLDTSSSTVLIPRNQHLGHSPRFKGAWSFPNEDYEEGEDALGEALFHFRFYKLKED